MQRKPFTANLIMVPSWHFGVSSTFFQVSSGRNGRKWEKTPFFQFLPNVQKKPISSGRNPTLLDCKEKDSESCKIISDICEGFSLKNLIQTPTRVTHDHTAILDLILTNVANTFKSGVINYNISDHSPVFMIKKRQTIKHERGYVIGRSYMNYDKIAFQNNLKNLDWSIIFLLDNPNDAWNMLYKAILLEADKMCPKRKIKISYNRPTWLTEELTEIGKEREILLSDTLGEWKVRPPLHTLEI